MIWVEQMPASLACLILSGIYILIFGAPAL